MKTTRLALILALSSTATLARAGQTVDLSGWSQVKTPEINLISQMSASDTADWASRLNQFLQALKTRLPVDTRLLGPYNLVLFKNVDDYWSLAPVLKSGMPLANVAAFSRSGDWGTIGATAERGVDQGTQRMIFETCVSWMLSADHRYRPMALSTGLREVYGAYVVDQGSEIFGRPVEGWTSALQRAEKNTLVNGEAFLKIEDLMSIRDFNPVADVHGVHMFFIESWGFAHFLLFSKEMQKEHAMDKLLTAFSHTHNAHEALKETFGDGANFINSRFAAYIQGGDFYEIALPVEEPPALGSQTPADPAIVATLLSRLEGSTGHTDVARTYAQQAIQLAPNDPRPREALALADYRSFRDEDTAADCREAIRLGSRDSWTWFEASSEIGRSGSSPENPAGHVQLTADQARDVANKSEKAILLCKGLEVAYVKVASSIPVSSRVTEDDGKFLALGRTLFPNNGLIEIGHAQWAHRINEGALALNILGDMLARPEAFTPAEIEQAKALRDQWSAHSG